MNKRIIIPVVLLAIIIIAIISKCGSSSKVILEWQSVAPSNSPKDSIELKVYIENSGSMDAYMCPGSNLKEAVFDYVSDLKSFATKDSLFYINSKIIPYRGDLKSFIKDLTPASFARAGGNRRDTDLMQIFDSILRNQKGNTVSVFVSDCILDIPQNAIHYLGLCQVSIKNTFTEAIKNNPYLGVEIIKLESNFDGWWYCGQNRALLHDVKRPYYIWIIGDQRHLARFNNAKPVENIIGGIKEYCAYATSQAIPFDIEKSKYVVNHTGKIYVNILVNLNGALQRNEIVKKSTSFKSANPAQITVVSVNEITAKDSPYSHVVELEIENPLTVKTETITFSYPELATWVSNSDDATGKNVEENMDKTTGLFALIKGVADAFKNATTYGEISFEVKNK